MTEQNQTSTLGRLIGLGMLMLIPVLILAALMPALSSARKLSQKSSMAYSRHYEGQQAAALTVADEASIKPAPRNAIVKRFEAEVNLTPSLSVGTATPESIYVAEMKASISALAPDSDSAACMIEFPLPPQIISLADVEITLNGEETEEFGINGNKLVWSGVLDAEKPAEINVAYSATGKGIYILEKPSGKIIEQFRTMLIANRSNIRMMELSLQPSKLEQASGKTTYTWDYKRLVVARPIAIDVLGIAAIDRLGELTWLGPMGVLLFGILIALMALSLDPAKLNGWLVIMVTGCFAGAYPMMYFLQDFISLNTAIAISALAVTAVIGWRVISLFGVKHGIFGGIILPAIIISLTVSSAVNTKPAVQGMLMTILVIFGFVVAMVVLPGAQKGLNKEKAPTIG